MSGRDPFLRIQAEVGKQIDANLEACASTTAGEILRDFGKTYARIEVQLTLLELRFLKDKFRHELPEQFAHSFHAVGAQIGLVDRITHSKENGLNAARTRRVVKFYEAFGNVIDTDESGLRLRAFEQLLKVSCSRDGAKAEFLCLCKAICLSEGAEKLRGIPVGGGVHKIFDFLETGFGELRKRAFVRLAAVFMIGAFGV